MAFLGSEEAAAACLVALAERGLVELCVTPPARRRGRRAAPTPTPVGGAAERLGLPVLATEDVNAADPLAALRAARPKLLVVVAFGQILRRPVREAAALGAVNLHFSLLPRWRGAAPVQRAILEGDAETGASVQRVAARLDAGAVLAEAPVAIGPRDDTPTLHRRLTERGAPLLVEVVERLIRGAEVPERAQDESRVTYAPRIERAEGDLDFAAETGEELDRRVRALEPWPRCRALLVRDGGEVEIGVREAWPAAGTGIPGTVLAADADGLVVAARAGALRITRLQRGGGRDLDVRAFLNGFPVAPGERFQALRSARNST